MGIVTPDKTARYKHDHWSKKVSIDGKLFNELPKSGIQQLNQQQSQIFGLYRQHYHRNPCNRSSSFQFSWLQSVCFPLALKDCCDPRSAKENLSYFREHWCGWTLAGQFRLFLKKRFADVLPAALQRGFRRWFAARCHLTYDRLS